MKAEISNKHVSATVVIVIISLMLLMYQATVKSLYELWVTSSNVTYTHGSLLVLVCIYLFYKKWVDVGGVKVNPSYIGVVLLSLTSMLWFLTTLADVVIASQLLIIIITSLIIWTLFGFRVCRSFLFPILLIICAVPVWEVINEGWLQQITAYSVSQMLEIVGITNYNEGVLIHISAGTFRVAENCSGMRQLVAAITIAAIFAYINNFRVISMIAYIVIAILVSILINVIRIFTVVVSGQLTDMQHYFVQHDHVTLGWVLFGIGIFIFIYFTNRLLPEEKDEDNKQGNEEHKISAIDNNKFSENKTVVKALALALISLSTGPLSMQYFADKSYGEMGVFEVSDNFEIWQADKHIEYDYKPDFLPATTVYEAVYKNEADRVYCYIGYYWKQEQGRELVSSLNKINDGKKWPNKKKTRRKVNINDEELLVDEIILKSVSGKGKIIWHWYYLSGRKTSHPVAAKILGVWGRLTGDIGAASILIGTDIDVDVNKARSKLENFLSHSLVGIEDTMVTASGLNK